MRGEGMTCAAAMGRPWRNALGEDAGHDPSEVVVVVRELWRMAADASVLRSDVGRRDSNAARGGRVVVCSVFAGCGGAQGGSQAVIIRVAAVPFLVVGFVLGLLVVAPVMTMWAGVQAAIQFCWES